MSKFPNITFNNCVEFFSLLLLLRLNSHRFNKNIYLNYENNKFITWRKCINSYLYFIYLNYSIYC